MSTRVIKINRGTDLASLINLMSQNLSMQGFAVQSQIMSPASANLVITKDRDGFKNIVGLGLECRVTLTVTGENQLSVNIESEWTNKIIAIAVGWFVCLIPFITGIVGTINQSNLPEKIFACVDAAAASTGNNPQM
ncbi:MAG: hypothetical protein IJF40_01145 [Clostridia bacterium]|nr:hypothetical protein [Clostridia bacterium]